MPRISNLTELRLFFASAVLVAHTIQLAGFGDYDIWRKIFSSEVAVQGFFILSGFLVLGSYDRTLDAGKFYVRRFLRIYPGYLVAVMFFLGLALVQAHLQQQDVQHGEVSRYVVVNLLLLNFLQPGIDGVFHASQYPEINGALWTIKLEVMFYALVPLLHWAGQRWSFRPVAIALIMIGQTWRPLLEWLTTMGLQIHPSIGHQLPGQLHFFGLGVLMFDLSRHPRHRRGNMAVVIAAVLVSALMGETHMALQVLLLSLFIYGVTQLPQLRSPLGDTDLSYGVYLAHFPIIQLLIGAGAVGLGAPTFMLLVVALAMAYAMASWHWVEHPALRLTRRATA